MNRVIAQREALERGFAKSLWISVIGHTVIVGAAVAAPMLLPSKPVLRVAPGVIVPVPAGGGAPVAQAPARPASQAPEPEPPKAAPEPERQPEPPKILKPPKPEPEKRKGPPAPDAKKRRRSRPTPTPAPAPSSASAGTGPSVPGAQGVVGAQVGPGIPGGSGTAGDWYLAGVVGRIASIWHAQLRGDFNREVLIRFRIHEDGSIDQVEVLQSSGSSLLDNAAQRAVYSAAPFAPLPKRYEIKPFPIRILFQPRS